ncbi:AI-2E family transporter [Flexivirga oryzae]|uniref:Putative PurR-regulated permease PerM n=1 Tax=Flexivirga oryzae TaxID=1794944 RepID=A0A839N7E7_9MICO|nr:AI-2E family transporter [Flexivirga oryzae]MBB2892669.1 putative PurR-regulated permease PerM [Flexivirga oryzae]
MRLRRHRPSDPGPVVERDEQRTDARLKSGADDVPSAAEAVERNPNKGIDRAAVISHALKWTASWSLRFLVVVAATWVVLQILGMFWPALLPVAIALLVTTVLWPPVRWMRAHNVPPALAAVGGMLLAVVVVGGIIAAMAPTVSSQWGDLVNQSVAGVNQLRDELQNGPLHIQPDQIDQATTSITDRLKSSGDRIASEVWGGITLAGQVLIDGVVALILTFFFLKDGPRLLPWLRVSVGRGAGAHLTEALTRVWNTLSGFIRTQAIVSAVDSICIGIGLVALQIPLAVPLIVLTFFGGFIPIVGAFAAGTIAVLVALVAGGITKAVIVLIIIVAVQQIEGHVLQPLLQSRSMSLHPAIVLLSIAFGGDQYGIMGAFFAVPVAASVAVLWRYLSEQIDLRTGDASAAELRQATSEGEYAAARGADHGRLLARLHGRSD